MKKRIAFVVTRYGKDINGGTEQHCRMLAERLVPYYNVEVLTTCAQDCTKGGNEYSEGEEIINEVFVKRFKVAPIHPESHNYYVRKSKWNRRLRKHLYQLRLLRFFASIWPIWKLEREKELKVMKSYVFYSSDLFVYLKENQHDYKAIIPINISYPLAYYASLCIPDKIILIPTMHYESSTFRSIYTEVFTKVAYIGFNTDAEQKLAEGIFSKTQMAPHGIISVGIDDASDADWEKTKKKYNLPNDYLLFVGRIDKGKLNHVINYFLAYKAKYVNSNLNFVLVGGLFSTPTHHPNIIYTGFVDENEKYSIIQHAKVLINPSKFESLSLILLEGMSRGKAMLVNGRCPVLKEHCNKSQGAALYYLSKRDFISKLYRLESSEELRLQMGRKGKIYVMQNYSWGLIIERLKKVINSI